MRSPVFAGALCLLALSIRSLAESERTTSDGEKAVPKSFVLHAIQEASRKWAAISRWRLEYSIRSSRGSSKRMTLAAGAPDRLYAYSANASKLYSSENDPFGQSLHLNNERQYWQSPFNRLFSDVALPKNSALPDSFGQSVVLPSIPVWPVRAYATPRASFSDAILPAEDALRSGAYSCAPANETMNGERCWIFERSGIDRIWISVDKSLAIMRRDLSYPRQPWRMDRMITDRLTEVSPGLWWPMDFRYQMLSHSLDAATHDVVELEYAVRTERFALNAEVPESTFVPQLAPGAVRKDTTNQLTQVLPGGEDLLDCMVVYMRALGMPNGSQANSHPLRWFLIGLVSGAAFGLTSLRLSGRWGPS